MYVTIFIDLFHTAASVYKVNLNILCMYFNCKVAIFLHCLPCDLASSPGLRGGGGGGGGEGPGDEATCDQTFHMSPETS